MVSPAAELQAAAPLLKDYCAGPNAAFYKQKDSDPHPLMCEKVSEDVTQCYNSLKAKIAATASSEFTSFAECLETSHYDLKKCQGYQKALIDAFKK